MGISRLRAPSPARLIPSPKQSPRNSFAVDWDSETVMDMSRPASLAIPRTASPLIKAPTLSEILSNTAPPPWTLSAFMAYLSHNHCLETLEFILDAERYRAAYAQSVESAGNTANACEQVCLMWRKVIEAYIMPCAPREVNMPATVRDRLLRLGCSTARPPHPNELSEAVGITHDLMNDSVLLPFLESKSPVLADQQESDGSDSRQGRSRLRVPREHSGDEAGHSPRASLRLLGLGRNQRSTSASADSADVEMVSDYSNSNSPSSEPVTPPTTPPASEFSFATSPNSLHRAITGHGWKKMGAKLGLGRKSKSISRADRMATENEAVYVHGHANPRSL